MEKGKVMKRILLALSIAAGVAGLGFSGVALATCYNGYCPNNSSPVVGGYTTWQSTCRSRYCRTNNAIRPFGDVRLTSRYGLGWFGNGTYLDWAVANPFECPVNTAAIQVPYGYKADNGQWYKNVFVKNVWDVSRYIGWGGAWVQGHTVVCVKTDTY